MNNPVDFHPEDLLDDERSGEITPSQLARLNAHTAICAPCALVRAATRDFETERRISAADAALVARINLAGLNSAVAGPTSGRRSAFIPSRRRRGRRAWAVGAVLLFAATGSAASFWSVRHVIVSRLLAKAPTQAPLPEAAQKESPAPRVAGAARTESPRIEFVTPPVEPVVPAPQPRLAPPTAGSPPVARARASEEGAPLGADQVFAAANEARRRGDSAQAAKLYRQLQQQFPGTREELTSLALLGRLLLDRGEDPAQSLALFTRYLAESPNGTLAEEARSGKALSLMRLGRTQEERQAWQELLSSHPKSIQAERARKRLDELR
jgi:TolA-binding protein